VDARVGGNVGDKVAVEARVGSNIGVYVPVDEIAETSRVCATDVCAIEVSLASAVCVAQMGI
jgi:hypothetical protein